MLTCHELFGFMPPALAIEIIETTAHVDKPAYEAVLSAVAAARKVRPEFLKKKPKADRHRDMAASLAAPRLDETAALLLRQWLTTAQVSLLADFLNHLGIKHHDGIVESFPDTVADEALKGAIDALLAKYPEKHVSVYLHSLAAMQLVNWPNLTNLLQADPRVQLA
jgi:hypothetical protein